MKIIHVIIFSVFMLFTINSCKDDPTSNDEKVTIYVRYNYPSRSYASSYETFSAVASISWNGGNTTVANSSQPTNISVPKGANLTATYSKFYKSYKSSAYDRTYNYKKTLVADGNKDWSL